MIVLMRVLSKKYALEVLYSFLFLVSLITFFNERKYQYDWLSIAIFILISSFIFGMFHVVYSGDWNNISVYIISGFILSLLLILSKDIKACIIYHILTNTFPILYNNDLEYIKTLIIAGLFLVSIAYVLRNIRKII